MMTPANLSCYSYPGFVLIRMGYGDNHTPLCYGIIKRDLQNLLKSTQSIIFSAHGQITYMSFQTSPCASSGRISALIQTTNISRESDTRHNVLGTYLQLKIYVYNLPPMIIAML